MVTRIHLQHAIVVRLHARKSNVVILTPEKAGYHWCLSRNLSLSVGVSTQDGAGMLPGPRDRGLTTTRTLFTCTLNWKLRRMEEFPANTCVVVSLLSREKSSTFDAPVLLMERCEIKF